MNITKALKLAQKHITVSYHGGYYVAKPFYGLSDVGGPTNAPTSTCDYHKAVASCRSERISQVVLAVTGDADYASECEYDEICDGPTTEDWRSAARRYVRAYSPEVSA